MLDKPSEAPQAERSVEDKSREPYEAPSIVFQREGIAPTASCMCRCGIFTGSGSGKGALEE